MYLIVNFKISSQNWSLQHLKSVWYVNTMNNSALFEKCPIMACEYHQLCWIGDSAKLSLLTLGLLDLVVVMVELSANTENNSTLFEKCPIMACEYHQIC